MSLKGEIVVVDGAFGNGVFVTVGECDPNWKFRTRFRSVTPDA